MEGERSRDRREEAGGAGPEKTQRSDEQWQAVKEGGL